jgi:serine/threonine protein phosphatase 1
MLNEMLAPATLPAGLRVYAVGDVHGCDDRLAALHAQIAADAWWRPPPGRVAIVHVGDYVDRGPESAAVIRRLLGPSPLPGAELVHLLGNHEAMMLDAFDPRAPEGSVEFWLDNGGAATLASYGAAAEDAGSWDAVPAGHLDFLRGCRLRWEAGGYLFVHAGVRPDLALDAQDPFDLLWMREPFLSWEGELDAVVVHGHTPTAAPEILAHRIGIDTGAVFGGSLTCLVLEGDRMRFLTA